MQCAEHLRVQALFDGELDAVSAAAVERHVGHCADCRTLLEELERMRGRIRRDLEYGEAPRELRSALARALDAEAAAEERRRSPPVVWRGRPFWLGTLTGAGAALAAGVAVVLLAPLFFAPLPEELIAAHLRSLEPGRLTQVISTDRHTVKPWFAGRADVSPVVADFAPQGFALVGGRTDSLGQQRAAVLVYAHGAHVINVFAFLPGRGEPPAQASRRGYHIACWRGGDLDYCAVSDAGWEELGTLRELIADLGARDAR
ncbi:MAG TPA: zf-HC2 domain-containing protein [Steroidobacteraceae bacterium]|nr:zf-HC2 domain-containing protein [Gammaproteobacteria bacterium]HEV2285823.1 zf-HC2 domain-containing protein [Steroidobacteraceae bacterium]